MQGLWVPQDFKDHKGLRVNKALLEAQAPQAPKDLWEKVVPLGSRVTQVPRVRMARLATQVNRVERVPREHPDLQVPLVSRAALGSLVMLDSRVTRARPAPLVNRDPLGLQDRLEQQANKGS